MMSLKKQLILYTVSVSIVIIIQFILLLKL